jgi:hypothetical protein
LARYDFSADDVTSPYVAKRNLDGLEQLAADSPLDAVDHLLGLVGAAPVGNRLEVVVEQLELALVLPPAVLNGDL